MAQEATGWDFEGMRTQALAGQAARARSEEARWRGEFDTKQAERDELMSQVRLATPAEYSQWVTGWVQAGGELKHEWFTDSPMSTRDWFVAYADLAVPALYGALAVNILIPAGVEDRGGDTGHNTLYITKQDGNGDLRYLVRGFHDRQAHANARVPIYSDTVFLG